MVIFMYIALAMLFCLLYAFIFIALEDCRFIFPSKFRIKHTESGEHVPQAKFKMFPFWVDYHNSSLDSEYFKHISDAAKSIERSKEYIDTKRKQKKYTHTNVKFGPDNEIIVDRTDDN